MRARSKRIAKVKYAIDASPVRRHLLREAYEWFRDVGELPDDDHVAFEAVQQALRGGEEAPPMEEAALAGRVRQAALAYHERERPSDVWPPTVRAYLFDEALFESPPLRKLARAAIACEVAYGGDVENPAFAARHGIPGYGSVALHVVGWPRSLIRPPYEAQATRLLVRMDDIRGRVPQDDPSWLDAHSAALAAFHDDGVLPEDDLLREAVLVDAEQAALLRHKRGEDVTDLMAAFHQVAWADGDERQESLDQLKQLVRAGGLRPKAR